MMDAAWTSEVARYMKLSEAERQQWLARLMFSLTILARHTYVVGGDDLSDSKRMRRFNELMHRAASQLRNHLEKSCGRSDEDFLNLVGGELEALRINSQSLTEMLR